MEILLKHLANPKGVGIIVLQNGKVLLGKRKDSGQWGLAGGAIDPGEEPLEAAIRELREEFGIINNNLKYYGVAPSPINPFKGTDFKEGCSIDYYVEYEPHEAIKVSLEPKEMTDFKWVDLNKALEENLYPSSRASLELFLRV